MQRSVLSQEISVKSFHIKLASLNLRYLKYSLFFPLFPEPLDWIKLILEQLKEGMYFSYRIKISVIQTLFVEEFEFVLSRHQNDTNVDKAHN